MNGYRVIHWDNRISREIMEEFSRWIVVRAAHDPVLVVSLEGILEPHDRIITLSFFKNHIELC